MSPPERKMLIASRFERARIKQREDREKFFAFVNTHQEFRKHLARSSFYWFAHIYFAKYIHYETADFQREMYQALQDLLAIGKEDTIDLVKLLEVLAFRGSTKSTVISLIFVIWAIISFWDARFVVLVGDTFPQARQYLYNVKSELENNELLIEDFGPFKPESDENDEWQKTSIVIPKYSARVSAHSSGQNVRGLRHLDRRPDIVIGDDLENLKGVKKKEQRDKLYNWVKAELLQIGDRRTRFIFLGNLLHSDSLMSRLKAEILSGKLTGRLLQFPIIKPNGDPIWPGKFPTREALAAEERRINNPRAWIREALLKIVADEGQDVKDEWIIHAKEIPKEFVPSAKGAGVDLAISKKETADFTSIVPGVAGRLNGKPKIYIKKPINEHFSMHETVEQLRLMQSVEPGMRFFVERVGYQEAAIETMRLSWINVDPVQPMADKRARLQAVARYIQDGTIEFLEGTEDLIIQLTHLGVEEHDDLVDAFVYLILGLLRDVIQESKVIWL